MEERKVTNTHFVLLNKHPTKGLSRMAIPMILAFILQTAFNIVDTIFVGRLGASAIAGLSLAFPFQMFIIALGGGFGIGAQSLISRSIGAKKFVDADNAAEHALLLAVVSGVFTTCVGLLSIKYIIGTLGAPQEVSGLALDYLGIIMTGSIFIFLNIISNSILRGEGDTRRPMIFMGFAAILNIILDPIFIFTFGWGVSGAALATVLSRSIVTLLICYTLLIKNRSFVQFNLRHFSFNLHILRKIFNVGFPASMAQIAMSLSLFFLNDILAPYGRDALAAFGLGFRVESIVFLPMIGLSGAFVSAVGFFKGSKQMDKIDVIMHYSLKVLVIFMCICTIVFFLFPIPLLRIFTDEAGVLSIGREYLRILSPFYILLPLSLLSAAGFQGIGKGYPAFLLALLRSGLVSVPLALYLTHVRNYGVASVWWAIVLGDVISAAVGYMWFKHDLTRLKNQIKETKTL